MTMVIPPIIQFLGTIDAELPLSTRILISASDVFANYGLILLTVIALAALILLAARRSSEKTALKIDRLILQLPLAGSVLRKLALSRFAHSFAILFQSGIGVIESMKGAGGTLGNRALSAMLTEAEQQVRSGRTLSVALGDLLPPFAVHMLRIGERSNQLGKALDDIAVTADRESAEIVTQLIGAMEPMLTMLIGGMLAWIVLAVLGPIYGSLGKIGAMM